MGAAAAFFLSFIPGVFYAWVVYWMDRYEKEPKLLVGGVFLWGAVVAAGGAYILNTVFGIGVYLITGSEGLAELTTGSIAAPLTEESLKALAVLLVFLIFRNEFDSIMDGIVYAGIVALGFAATENAFYLCEVGCVEGRLDWDALWFMFFLRVVFGAWNHAFYTAFTGIGLAVARLSKSWAVKIGAPIVGGGVAVFFHYLHNVVGSFVEGLGGLVAVFAVDWFGWLFMALVILWASWRLQGWIKNQLKAEMDSGLITAAQYKTAASAWARSLASLRGVSGGRYLSTRRFYQLCSELAFKKHQLQHLGEERGNTAMIEKLRGEIKQLASQAAA